MVQQQASAARWWHYVLAVLAGLACAAVIVLVGGMAYLVGLGVLIVLTIILGISTVLWERKHHRSSGVFGVYTTFALTTIAASVAAMLWLGETPCTQRVARAPAKVALAKTPPKPAPVAKPRVKSTPVVKPAPLVVAEFPPPSESRRTRVRQSSPSPDRTDQA